MMKRVFHLTWPMLCLTACLRHETPPQAPATSPNPTTAAPASSASRFGAPLSPGPTVQAGAILLDPARWDDKDVKVTGQVGGVCQRKGCWLTLGSGELGTKTMRVTFKDYSFFVPKDCLGKQAVIEGHLRVTTLSQAQAQHYADDAAKDGVAPQKVETPQPTLALVATGVELR